MTTSYCPSCGAQRTGGLRFCGSCAYDFDADAAPAAPILTADPITPTIEASKKGGTHPLAVIGLVLLIGIVGGIAVVNMQKGGPMISASQSGANVPPAGQIWFGSSFDPSTLALSSRITSMTGSGAFSAVAHLPRSMNGSDLNMREYFNGELIATVGLRWDGSSELWGWSPGPLFAVGSWRYEITDIGGNVLASGSIQDN